MVPHIRRSFFFNLRSATNIHHGAWCTSYNKRSSQREDLLLGKLGIFIGMQLKVAAGSTP